MSTFEDLIQDGIEDKKSLHPMFKTIFFIFATLLGLCLFFGNTSSQENSFNDYEEVVISAKFKTNFKQYKEVSLYFPKKELHLKNCLLKSLISSKERSDLVSILVPKDKIKEFPIFEKIIWILPVGKSIVSKKKIRRNIYDESF